jgi:hypothetical protein
MIAVQATLSSANAGNFCHTVCLVVANVRQCTYEEGHSQSYILPMGNEDWLANGVLEAAITGYSVSLSMQDHTGMIHSSS